MQLRDWFPLLANARREALFQQLRLCTDGVSPRMLDVIESRLLSWQGTPAGQSMISLSAAVYREWNVYVLTKAALLPPPPSPSAEDWGRTTSVEEWVDWARKPDCAVNPAVEKRQLCGCKRHTIAAGEDPYAAHRQHVSKYRQEQKTSRIEGATDIRPKPITCHMAEQWGEEFEG